MVGSLHTRRLAEPLAHVAGLHIAGGGTDIGDALRGGEVGVDGIVVDVELVAELDDGLADERSGLVGVIVVAQIVVVVVPVEVGVALALQPAEQLLLHREQGVETHQEVGTGTEVDVIVADHAAEEGPLVGQLLLPQ